MSSFAQIMMLLPLAGGIVLSLWTLLSLRAAVRAGMKSYPAAELHPPARADRLRAVVRVLWHSDTGQWVATSREIKGLTARSATFDEVIAQVKAAAPDLLAARGRKADKPLDLHFLADRLEQVAG
jgi:predicted RNase H-like HicB family nuclease